MMDGKRWKKCPKGHVLGEIVRVDVGQKRYATRLLLFRHAVGPENATAGVVGAVLEGTAPELFCDLCQNGAGPWVIGAEALDYLLQTRLRK